MSVSPLSIPDIEPARESLDGQEVAGLSEHNHARVADLFHALSEPNRLAIIHCLADAPHRVGEIASHVGLAQSTVSAHLAMLREAHIVSSRPEGRSTWYRLSNPYLGHVLDAAERLVAGYDSDDDGEGSGTARRAARTQAGGEEG